MTLPLEGKIILDLSRMLPGPYCTMILSDLGADVIRVEDPKYLYSNVPPFFQKGKYRDSAFNAILMRNKKSITLNLKKEKALEIFYELVKSADIVMDTFRPKVMEKLKIDYKTLSSINPSIICCSLTGYGQFGPYEQLAGHDLNYIGICGILDATRERIIFGKENQERKPINPGVQPADIGGALVSAIGILSAIIEREKNPERKGQYIDISMTDSVFSFMPMAAALHFAKEYNKKNSGENILEGGMAYYAVYSTKDNKYLSIGAIEMKFWHNLCEGLGREDLKGKQWAIRAEKEKVFEELQKEFSKKTQQEWLEIFKNYDTCIAPVNNFAEACEDPQIQARKMVVEMDHPVLGKIKNIASPIKMSRTPPTIRSPAPKIGQNTAEILKQLNYTDEDIQNFKKNKII
ncbi:MAG: CoA transferase [Promethearchaeota archaeon]|nr:MAG: CoA transferase [Candidatus Lokiarchaeota archaeon]